MAATVQTLIRLGADVNSVADDDLMPLLIAKTINLQSEQVSGHASHSQIASIILWPLCAL